MLAAYDPPASCKVYTPAPLARAIVGSLYQGKEDSWLEPSVGRGAFLEAISEFGVGADRITAVDLEATAHPAHRLASTLRGVDFLAWASITEQRFDRVAANPPFLALRSLPHSMQQLGRDISLPSGPVRLSGRSNLWASFLAKSLHLLNPGGSLGFVLPAAWEYADYAAQLRVEMPSFFAEWFTFRCEKPLFSEVQEGSVVLIARGFRDAFRQRINVRCRDLASLCTELSTRRDCRLSLENSIADRQKLQSVRFGDIADVRLGGVTGDSKYFLLREQQRLDLGLPVHAVQPVLSKAKHLGAGVIDRTEWERLRDSNARVWLFRPSKKALAHVKVQEYLRRRYKSGGCNRKALKVRCRKVWYRVPLPCGIHGFISGMTKVGPTLVLRDMSRLTATNTLYTVHFRGRSDKRQRIAWALAFLSSSVRKQLRTSCRRYAAGLPKFEPRDLQNLQIPIAHVCHDPSAAYRIALEAFKLGDDVRASRIADEWFQNAAKSADRGKMTLSRDKISLSVKKGLIC